MNIPLLADKTHAVSRAYGVLKEDDGISFRGLFIIDGKSVLRQVRFSMALSFVAALGQLLPLPGHALKHFMLL